jgi:NAD(P)H dehydrogenase (quinone)
MQHLIVVAHPLEDSITMRLTRAYALQLQQLGHSQQTHDLYRMGFNPVMGAHELEPLSIGHAADADVAQAQQDVCAADALTVIYPLWWATMPAMMKGYIDRVFARGFAYEARSGVAQGLMDGKRCVLITLSGSPLAILLANGEWKAMATLQDAHIFRSSGFELLEHLHFDEVESPTPDDVVERDLASVRACARRHFAASGGAKDGSVHV